MVIRSSLAEATVTRPVAQAPAGLAPKGVSGRPEKEVEPYGALANIYERVMSHVDYAAWARFTVDLLGDAGIWENPDPPRILECACGSGTLAMALSHYGFTIDAFDRSPAMIDRALAKASGAVNAPSFYVGSFQSFRAEPPYDAALCLYDSLNYILDPGEVVGFLKRLREILAPGGLFLFDVCTEKNSLAHFNDRVERDKGPGFTYVRSMTYHRGERIQENRFEIFFSGSSEAFVEVHRQRIYPLEEIYRFVRAAGWTILEKSDGMGRRPASETSLRVHILAKRAG